MDTYFSGQILRLSVEFRDNAGDLADPTTVVFSHRVDQGDIETLTYGTDVELVRDSLGVFYTDLSLTVAGTYAYRFIGGGAIENSIEDAFLVIVALDTEPIVELQEAKSFLRITDDDEDGLITIMLYGIEATIKENLSNYIVAQESSVYLDGGGESMRIPRVPVSELEDDTVVVHDDIYNVDVDTDMYRLVPTTGQLYYKNEATLWPEGAKRYLVTYTSGFSLREDYDELVRRIKLAELTWLADIYWNRGASTSKETIDEVSQAYDLTRDLPKNVYTLLQGLLDVLSDF